MELANAIRLDLNYYYWPPAWVQDRPGFFTGSGMPMRFADLDGTIIDVYQACTQMTDESGQSYPFTIDTLLDGALGPQGYYGVFAANMHTDFNPSPGSDAIVASAQARGVPIVSGRQMLTWLDGRNNSSFGSINWSNGTLSFTVTAGAGANGLQAMVPTASAAGPLSSITSSANPVAYTNQTIKGVEYAFFSVTNGTYEATYSPDTTPPVISAVTATPGLGGVATITWTTDEASDSEVIYGTDPNSLTLTGHDPTLVPSHSIMLTGLSISTTYYYRVVSTDVYGNSATSPASPAPPASFNTPSAGFVDTTVADFSAGTPGANTYISQTADGEVILNPTVGAEFYGSTLPAGWTTATWGAGGAVTVAGGSLTADGAIAQTTASYGPGRSLEFVATFGATTFQHVGFASDINSSAPWAIFSTFNTGTGLYARTALAGNSGAIDTLIPGNWLGSPHRYRIDWTASNVVFSIDGTPVATNSTVISSAMLPEVSDFNEGAPDLTVDWMRMSPYAATGTFVSRVFDAGSAANWTALSWDSQMPAGMTLTLGYRIGNTLTPDGSWTVFSPVSASGGALSGNSRYIQYSAQLATSDPNQTPELDDVTISYNLNPDTTPLIIVSALPASGATGVSTNTTVTLSFNEPMNTATVTSSSFRLRRMGDSFDLAATVSCPGATATLTPNSPLLPGQTYQVTVAGTVADANGNSLGADTVWTFSTTPATVSQTDTTVADFSAGSTAGCSLVVSEIGDGEVILAPTLDEEFPGTSLSASWTSGNWPGGGTVAVSGDVLSVDGAYVETTSSYPAGTSLDFVATFGAEQYQHVGFATDASFSSFAMFSTAGSTTSLYARTSVGGDTLIPGSWLGTPHRFRIDWTASSVVFWIDGVAVASQAVPIGANMRPIVSDYNVGGPNLTVNWMRMSPYTTPCTFTSRVIDAGQAVTWSTLAWDALTPTGTSLTLSYRTGNTPIPDGSWTAFTPVNASGGALAGSSRYLQYAAQLATSDTTQTPVLEDVAVTYILTCSPPAITGNPSSSTNCVGDPVAFAVTATGTGLTYQWRKNGTDIDGALGSSYTIPSVTTGDTGIYDVVVSGPCGSPAISSPANLLVNVAPMITCPANITVSAAPNQCSSNIAFVVTATGSPAPIVTCKIDSTLIASPYLFPVGTTTVNCTASNSCGIATCDFTVTVHDTTPPVLSLTAPAGVSADTNCQAAVPAVVYQVSDNCDANPTVTQTPSAGTLVGEGSTTITVVATDASGNATTRTTTFTVSDTTAPVITWSFTNLVLQTSSDSCQTNMIDVTGTNYVQAWDACSGTNLIITQEPTNGAVLLIGTNEVVIAVADQAGNTNYSTNTIVVVDVTPPSANVPADVVQANDAGQCGAVVNFTIPEQTDNCGVAGQVATPASGSFFEVGTTPVVVVVTDIHGNSSTNTFHVTVNDTEPPVIVTNLITITLDASGGYTLTASDLANLVTGSSDNCGIASTNVSRSTFSCDDVGTQTVQVTLTDVHGNSSTANATVSVRDITPPVIVVHPITVTLGGSGNYTLTASDIAALVAGSSDNCGMAGTNVSQTRFTFCDAGTPTVQVSLTDAHGNTSTAGATVNVTAPANAPTVVYVDAGYGTTCGAVTFPNSNGTGTYYVGYNAFNTIQAGIKAVAAGGTVNVAAGTYTESGQIHVTADLNVAGADEATTIIKKDFDTSNSGDTKGWWLVDPGVHFNLSNVTLDGTGHLVFQGIRSYGLIALNQVHFTNLQYNASGPDYDGRGVIGFDNGVLAATLNVTNCQFDAIGRIGVQYYGNCSGNVVNCTYTGKGAGDWLDYGFETGAGAVATIMSCVVTNCYGVASVDGSESAAVQPSTWFGDGTTTYVYNCTLTGNSYGIGVGFDSSDTSVVVARYNDLSDNSVQGIDTLSASVVVDAISNWWGSVTGPTIASNPGGTGVGVSSNVNYSPWLGAGADTSPAIGFQPDLTQAYYAADHLVFSTEPGGIGINQPLSPQPVVQVMDSNGGLDTIFNGSVTISFGNNPSGGVLRGTLTVPVISGTATFSNLSIDTAGAGYTLTASSTPPINSATSAGFDIANPLPSITALAPTWTTTGAPGFTLTVNGANFVADSVVRWNGSDRVTTNVSPTQLTAAITASDIASAGAVSVTVFNAAPGGGESAPAVFNIYAMPSVVYVNTSYTGGGTNDGHLWGYDAFNTVQTGINAVAVGGTVKVAAGTYPEVLVVNKPLTLSGAQAGQNANSRFAAFVSGTYGPKADPVIESILTAAATGPASAANDTLHIMADNVTVDGFVLDGNNPALSQDNAVAVGGINTDVRRAIETEDAAGNMFPANNASIKNNVIQNFAERGVELVNPTDTSPATSGSLITGNVVGNFGLDGIVLAFNAYADITSNTVITPDYPTEAGIWVQDFPNNGTGAKTIEIANNAVTVGQDNFGGIWVNLVYAPAATLNIHDNTVNAAAAVTGDDDYTFGIYLSSLQGGTTAHLSNNTVGATGGQFARAIALWNVPTTVRTTVTGGTVSNALKGVSLHYNDPNFGTAGAGYTVNLSGVNVSGTDVGVLVEAVDSGSDTVQMQISGNTTTAGCATGISVLGANAAANVHDNTASIAGNGIGIAVDGGKALIENNDLTGNSVAGILATNGAVVDAGTCGADATGLGASTGGNNLSGYLTGSAKAIVNANAGGTPVVLADHDNFGATSPADNLGAAFSGVVEYSQSPAVLSCPGPVTVTCVSDVPAGANSLAGFIAQGGYYSAGAASVSFSDTPHPTGSGTITRNYIVVDACGTTNTCTQVITISDTIPPTIDALPNLSFNANPGQCSKSNVTWTVSAHDNCAVASVVSLPPSGSTFEKGTTVVTNIATDTSSNTTITTFTVTVTDTEPPAIVTCASNQTVVADAITAQALMPDVASTVVASDNCGGVTLSQMPMPGITIGLGQHPVTVWATDQSGNSNSCTAMVTVIYTNSPVLTCVPDVTVTTLQDKDPYATGYPTAADPDGPVIITYADDYYGLTNCDATGPIIRTWTAKDASGNVSTCVQTVTVVDTNAPCFTSLPGDLTISNDPGQCSAVVNYAPTAIDPGYFQGFENPNFVSDTNGVSLDWHDGNSHLYRVTSGTDGIVSKSGVAHAVIDSTVPAAGPDYSASGAYTFFDGINSAFGMGYRVAIDVYMDLNDPAVTNATATTGYGWDLSTSASDAGGNYLRDFIFHTAAYGPTGIVVAADNSSNDNPDARRNDLLTLPNHAVLTHSGWYTFEWVFRNNTNNALAVDLNVRDTNGVVLFTQTLSDPDDLISNVGGNPYYMWFIFTFVDKLAIDNTTFERNVPVISSPASGSAFLVGTTIVTNTAVDACGNATNAAFTVTVIDVEQPVIQPITDIVTTNDVGQCGAIVTFPTLTATDNCAVAGVVASPDSGSTFPIGTTPVTVVATDIHGNSSTNTFHVTVNDTEPPSANVPADIVQANDPGQCGAVVNFTVPTQTDNCGVSNVVVSPASGSSFPAGTTPVTVVVTDIHGNSSSNIFHVTVNDAEPPALSLTAPAGMSADTNCQAAVPAVVYQVSDNCDANPTVTQNPLAGTLVGEGSTTITVVATDASGNATTRTTSFTVNDTTAPMITWSFTNLVLQTSSDSCQTNMIDVTGTNYVEAWDACSGTNLIITQEPTNGAVLLIGTNEVVIAVADQAGNTNYSTNTIVVVDMTPPSANVPADVVQANDAGQCGAVVNFTIPEQTDNCGVSNVVAEPASGSFFEVGTTPVVVVVTDIHGNSSTNTFHVTVHDTEPPFIQPIVNMIQAVDAGKDYATVTFAAQATDNCGIADLIAKPPSGSQFPIGTNTVTLVATDVHGNSAANTFTVAVLIPVTIITQPANQTAYVGGTASFSVTASGTLPLSYQWNFNQTNIANATNAMLVLNHIQPGQAGNYAVRVANPVSSILSSNAVLTINPAPVLQVMQAGNNLLIYWPVDAPGFVLETSPSLSPADWEPVTDAPLQIGGEYLELIEMAGTNQFYRLELSQ